MRMNQLNDLLAKARAAKETRERSDLTVACETCGTPERDGNLVLVTDENLSEQFLVCRNRVACADRRRTGPLLKTVGGP